MAIKLLFIKTLVVCITIYAISSNANENFMLYCHKESGECFSPKRERGTTIDYFGSRDIQDYEIVNVDVVPVKDVDMLLSEKKRQI